MPGYVAPEDTVGPASRPVLVLGGILVDAHAIGALPADSTESPLPTALGLEVRQVIAQVAVGVSEQVAARALMAWTELFGAISFELFGRLKNTIDEREAWFNYQVRAMAALVGLPG